MIRLRDNLPISEPPRFGCPASRDTDRSTHVLTWAGWWQSGNRNVAIPAWTCVCPEGRFTDATHARVYNDGKLGPLFDHLHSA